MPLFSQSNILWWFPTFSFWSPSSGLEWKFPGLNLNFNRGRLIGSRKPQQQTEIFSEAWNIWLKINLNQFEQKIVAGPLWSLKYGPSTYLVFVIFCTPTLFWGQEVRKFAEKLLRNKTAWIYILRFNFKLVFWFNQ